MKAEWNPGEVGDGCTVTITDDVFGAKEFGVQEACDILTAEIALMRLGLAAIQRAAEERCAWSFAEWMEQEGHYIAGKNRAYSESPERAVARWLAARAGR